MKKLYQNNRINSGFTIIELMIATTVFSVVLLLSTVALLQIGRTYNKGITETRTQDDTRSITDDITQSVQFSGNDPQLPSAASGGGGVMYFCAGGKRYTYKLGVQLQPVSTSHAMVRENGVTGCQQPVGFPPAGTGTELVDIRMRLANVSITQIPNTSLYTVTIRVVAGENDLLCSPGAGDCSLPTTTANLGATDLNCKSFNGSQFCAAAELTTTVQKRL